MTLSQIVKSVNTNVLLVILAVVADVALIVNVAHHWKPKEVEVHLSCVAYNGMINCGGVKKEPLMTYQPRTKPVNYYNGGC